MKMALAGKFLSVFLFLVCVQAALVTPAVSNRAGSGLVATAQADPVRPEPAKTDLGKTDLGKTGPVKTGLVKTDLGKPDSVRVLPDDFLSGNSGSGRQESEKTRTARQHADKPQAGKESGRTESGKAGSLPLSERSGASTPDGAKTGSGQTKKAETGTAPATDRRGASGESSPDVAGSLGSTQAASPSGLTAGSGWDLMPAGARPAYMGIHGGTMPVSLLVSNDGNSLLTFVGRTGNDFLDMLRRTDLPLPSLFNSTEGQLPRQVDLQAGLAGARVLSAGSGQSRMPVLCLTTDAFARIAPTPDMLQPFGLSDKPLALEGEVMPPDRTTPAKQFRMFFQPQYLQPGANRK